MSSLGHVSDWQPDPYRRYEFRWFSDGKPTSLVTSGTTASFDYVEWTHETDGHGGNDAEQTVETETRKRSLSRFRRRRSQGAHSKAEQAPAESEAFSGNALDEEVSVPTPYANDAVVA